MLALGMVGMLPGTPDLVLANLLPGGLRIGWPVASRYEVFPELLIWLPPATSLRGEAMPASTWATAPTSAPLRLATCCKHYRI